MSKKKQKIAEAKKVHFIGIGGIGISALARMLHHRGVEVSGVNDSESPETLDGLRKSGVKIDLLSGDYTLPEADIYVYSVAWEARAPEVLEQARATGARLMTYFEALGEIAQEYKVIAISGTHGKTTTTAMTAQALIAAGLNPTVIVGSMVSWPDTHELSNFHAGGDEYLVVEACEYKRHFLHFHPYILAITNIELDHTDYYKDLQDIQSAFSALKEQSEIVLDDKDIAKFLPEVPTLTVPGEYNRQNAALALAVTDTLISSKEARAKALQALKDFRGTWRRFDLKGKTQKGALVYDDYAHHPTAIRAVIAGTRDKYPQSKIVVAFESHTYSRTQSLMDEFAEALAQADEIVLAPIYFAREEAIPGVTHEALGEKTKKHNPNVHIVDTLQDAASKADELAQEADIIILMGAGDLYQYAKEIVAKNTCQDEVC